MSWSTYDAMMARQAKRKKKGRRAAKRLLRSFHAQAQSAWQARVEPDITKE